jgi:uroporphyrinogen decarboxylase
MTAERFKNDLFLRACKRRKVERTPIWIMRQAGRYLPQYRAIRAKYDFLTMCKTPEIASEITIQPVDILGVDAAILFSDILIVPEAMGMHLKIFEGKKLFFDHPVRSESDAKKLNQIIAENDLKYVLDAISLTKKELNGRVPLIGFCGAPWTLLTYMVEGQGRKIFSNVKKLIYNNPELAHKILNMLTNAVASFLSAQIKAGADAVQIFDTWAGNLSPRDYLVFALKYVNQVILKIERDNEPIIYFPKGVHYRMRTTADCGADVIGVDWTIDLAKARDKIGNKVAIQGNLDPTVLYAEPNFIRREAKKVLQSYGNGPGHIFNLGHSILPDTNPDHAKVLVDYVKEESESFHRKNGEM